MRPKACDMPLKDKYNTQRWEKEELKHFHLKCILYRLLYVSANCFVNLSASV